MLQIAVCDDENSACAQIENMLLSISKKYNKKFDIDVYCSGEELIRNMYNSDCYDIIFLDIKLHKINGVETGKIIREKLKNETTHIVYISATDSYAMELFDIRPLNFLIKPIKQEKLEEVLNKALLLIEKADNFYEYQVGSCSYKVLIEDIIYFESSGRKVNLISKEGNHSYYAKIRDIQNQLNNDDFILIHKSYLINYNHVKEYNYECVKMSNDKILPVSKSNRKFVRNQLLFRRRKVNGFE